MWARFFKSKDETSSYVGAIILEIKHLHAKYIAPSTTFAPIIKFNYDTVFEASDTQCMRAHLGVGTQFFAPSAHHMLGKAE
jgi:hypothetical protein